MFDYEQMIEDAMRVVVKQVLAQVAADGPTGEHCFYITFRTDHPETEIPFYLLDDHPLEMTIVLQHRFWDLTVKKDFFEVTLSFNNIQERLHIPFDAMTMFEDRTEKFALHFEPRLEREPQGVHDGQQQAFVEEAKSLLSGSAAEKKHTTTKAEATVPQEDSAHHGNVISMDTFRRK